MGFKQKMAEALDIPKDIALGSSKITILGQNEVSIENYKGILEYDESLIRIKTDERHVRILGGNLEIGAITEEDIQIRGAIKSVELGEF
ncbi:sporulation protein YqfC [Clostridia bacterium]|nr:sporulation protein YqfC [Clostridia bacterium]